MSSSKKARVLSYLVLSLGIGWTFAHAADGLITVKSASNVEQTTQRLEKVLKEKGVNVVATVDHAAAASKVGMKLQPTRVVIFGNPKAGTPLMQCAQSVGIDLPQKALIYEDGKGQTWIGYNDMQYLAKRHDMSKCKEAIESNAKALKAIIGQAAGASS